MGWWKKQDKLLSEDEFTAFTKRLSIQLIFTVLSRKLPIAYWFAFEFVNSNCAIPQKKMFINSGMFYFKHCVCVTDRICKETSRSWFNLWLIPILVVHFGSSFTLTFEFSWSPLLKVEGGPKKMGEQFVTLICLACSRHYYFWPH